MIRATSADEDIPQEELLKEARVYVDMGSNPIAKNLVDMLKALGADVAVGNEEIDPDFNIKNIIDPNERESEPILRLIKVAKETGRVVLAVDPDGDRGSIVAVGSDGKVVAMTGSELLLLAIEQLANSYHKKGLIAKIIGDMRTGVSARDLREKLNAKGIAVEVIPYEAGYPFFMRGMASILAAIAIENSTHGFTNPMTNINWGAPEDYRRSDGQGYQGGDNAALLLIYILGCMVHEWEGRNPVEQLEWIRKTYNLRPTVVDERKPVLPTKDDKFKYLIADRMKVLAENWFGENKQFLINFDDSDVTLVSGVHITNTETGAMMLVRFSNTGASFTISGEGYLKEGEDRSELDDMLGVGHLLLTEAVNQLRKEGHKFGFDISNAADLKGVFNPEEYGIDIRADGGQEDVLAGIILNTIKEFKNAKKLGQKNFENELRKKL